MTYKGFSPVDFARASATTLAHHIRDAEEAMLRNYQMLALLQSAGRVNYNNSGRGFDWQVQYRLHNVEGNTGQTQRNFARRNLWKLANLEYRGYQATDAMYMREFKENRGPEGVIKVFDQFTDRLETSMKEALAKQVYTDGSASGNEEFWHGLESMFATNGTVNNTDGTQRTANAADFVGYPNDEYANISTELGNFGGENEEGQVWPNGIADPEFDFWSPLVVNYESTGFGGDSNVFADQGDEAMRYGITHAQRNSSMDGQITNIWLARDLFIDFKNLMDDKEQINITSEHTLRALGFKDVIAFDGVEVSWEAGINSGVGYGLNYNCVELKSMDDQLLTSEGPEYDIHTQAFNAVVSTLSNFKFKSPRNFIKFDKTANL